ncbi:hypothetical protein OF83DRAFT_1166026 [Amylostereum chailletii]|nr:hypothetical protein OF83DRAFT_1166026 [Amylostereum chailletii]
MDTEQQLRLLAPDDHDLKSVKVFPLIRSVKKEVIVSAHTALSWDQLTASDINFAIVRPLVFKYARLTNPAILYVCLVVRSHFLNAAEDDLAFSAVNCSRANLCELLAMKLVNHFAHNRIQLVSVLTAGWNPLTGAAPDVVSDVKSLLGGDDKNIDNPQSALEVPSPSSPFQSALNSPSFFLLQMAIATRAKSFIATTVVQTVVNDIWSGRVVSISAATRSVIADNYKQRSVQIYDVREAPWLDHYRLRVPKYGAILECMNFAALLVTFLLCLTYQDATTVLPFEILFVVFALAFALDEYTASMEHGWSIYFANTWNVFDTGFVLITLVYIGLRIRGLVTDDVAISQLGFDILACGACILIPRLAFFLVSDNVIILALRAMGAEFLFFMGIAVVCFSGLAFTLWSLGGDKWSVRAIVWLMIQIWFGNTSMSFGQASSFHPVIGPIIMTIFAALSNTLLLTILISILGNTFTKIDANASQEYLYQFTITTLEGMKTDALISYQPPFNLLAFAILWPASFALTPRALHTANVFLIRLTSFPILITIHIYERFMLTHASLWGSTQTTAQTLYHSLPRALKALPLLDSLMRPNSSSVYEALFEVETELADDADDADPFGSDGEDDHVGLHSWTSRERERELDGVRTPERPAPRGRRSASHARLGGEGAGLSAPTSPRSRKAASLRPGSARNGGQQPVLHVGGAGEIPSGAHAPRSPLSRLFSGRLEAGNGSGGGGGESARLEAGIRRVQEVLEDVRDLPVNRLKEEMKELQERQARIEGLLMVLTRGMRHDTGGHGSRHDTL